MTARPTPEEAELFRSMGDWSRQAKGGTPPEMLRLLRDHVKKQADHAVAQAVEIERLRQDGRI